MNIWTEARDNARKESIKSNPALLKLTKKELLEQLAQSWVTIEKQDRKINLMKGGLK